MLLVIPFDMLQARSLSMSILENSCAFGQNAFRWEDIWSSSRARWAMSAVSKELVGRQWSSSRGCRNSSWVLQVRFAVSQEVIGRQQSSLRGCHSSSPALQARSAVSQEVIGRRQSSSRGCRSSGRALQARFAGSQEVIGRR